MLGIKVFGSYSVNQTWKCTHHSASLFLYSILLQGLTFSPLHSGFWPELAHSLAEYLCCTLFFPKWIVTISLHFSKMNCILLSPVKWNFLRFVYAFLILCFSVPYGISAKDICFLKEMPSSTSLKKILNIICSFNNVSYRSNLRPPHHCSASMDHPISLLLWSGD